MKKLKLYLMKFDKIGQIIPKVYYLDYKVEGDK